MLIKAGHQQEAKAGYKTGQARRGHRACIQEVYRVKLPGNPVVGEGKPENQNHAMIFSRGEHVQAIDMNQEGWVERDGGDNAMPVPCDCIVAYHTMPDRPLPRSST